MSTLDLNGLEKKLEGLGLGPIPQFSEAHVLNKPLDVGRAYLADILHGLVGCVPIAAYNSIQWPNDVFTADLTVPLPKLSRNADPTSLAIDLTQRFPSCPLFILPLRDGVHLRFMFTAKALSRLVLPYISDRKSLYGTNPSLGLRDPSSPDIGRQRLLIEFSSPNIASEFHGKHLRSTILGAYISNMYETMGWEVIKMNYLGDWGKHVGLFGAGWEKFGSEEKFQADPVGHMLSVYNQIDQLFQPELAASKAARDNGEDTSVIENRGIFEERNAFYKKMEDSDETTLALCKRFRDASIEYYIKLYANLNVTFDEYSGESQVSTKTMDEVEDMLKSKGICEESEGAWIVDLKKHGSKSGKVIIRDRNGSRTYSLRELAAALDRSRKHSFDKMIYVVADDHDMHFSGVKKILELLGMADLAHKLQHERFNKGSQILEELEHNHMLGTIIERCKTAMQDSLSANPEKSALFGDSDKSAATVGISALLAQELIAKRGSDHAFDIGKMTAFERGSGPELQFWYAKLKSIIKAAGSISTAFSDEDFKAIEEETYTDLLRILAQYPDVTAAAYKTLEPSTIMLYVLNITDQLQACFETEEEDEELSHTPAEIALFEITRQVLENIMKLLGIVPVAV